MGYKINYDSSEDAYEYIKQELTKKGYNVQEYKDISYGLQFNIKFNEVSELVRIYHSTKKGTTLDESQIKNSKIKSDLLSVFKLTEEQTTEFIEQASFGTVYSVCVGINNFTDSNYGSLTYADRDAEEFHQLLVEKFGVGEGTIKLVNEEASYKEIVNSIEKIKELAKLEDTVIIFLASHGEFHRHNDASDFYLISQDSDYNNLIPTALAMNKLKEIVKEIKSERKVIFLDTCHSGGITRRGSKEVPADMKEIIFENFSSKDFVIITSCLDNEMSHESKDLEHGVFTYYLLSGFTGAVEIKNDTIDLYTLYAYINKFVKYYVKTKLNANQTPKFFGNLKGPFVLPKLKESPIKSSNLKQYTKPELDNKTVKIKFETINCIGIDESGKGDYFGPLVVAGVYVDTQDKMEKLKAIGVKDSKKLSDARVIALAKRIFRDFDNEVVIISPSRYNTLYKGMANMNEILAWGHAQSLEQLLIRNKECDFAISDQFAFKDLLLSKLKEKGKQIQVIQRPKAEENLVVAAASVLARARFIQYLERMEKENKHNFPRGASQTVIQEAADFIRKSGNLSEVAKISFKTTEKVNELIKNSN
jgi:ribonuclease HIII